MFLIRNMEWCFQFLFMTKYLLQNTVKVEVLNWKWEKPFVTQPQTLITQLIYQKMEIVIQYKMPLAVKLANILYVKSQKMCLKASVLSREFVKCLIILDRQFTFWLITCLKTLKDAFVYYLLTLSFICKLL